MFRPCAPTWVAFIAALCVSTIAAAEQNTSTTEPASDKPAVTGKRISIQTPVDQFVPHAVISQTLYLERCKGGCTVQKGSVNDARTMTSSIVGTCPSGGCRISEYINNAGESGAAADAEWAALVQCMKEVYSPFDVNVTDVKPPAGSSAHVAIVAGIPQEAGFSGDILGVAPVARDCSPQDNVISFSFANAHQPGSTRVFDLCHTVAQESAHAFGLDHAFEFLDGRSTCNDPMTYRFDCGGQRFFRNESAKCGEYEERDCQCGSTQNSHSKLLAVFGAGTPLTAPPTVTVTLPASSGGTLGAVVGARAKSQRGISKVELLLNGYKWAEAKGAAFGQNGQPETTYSIMVPGNVPNSIVDVVVRAYDDLGTFTDSQVVTVTKGAPCTSADTCATGQKCEAGKCFWVPPAGELGDECSYPQFCKSGLCQGTAELQVCTQPCIPDVQDSCPNDLTCAKTGVGQGICFPGEAEGGGCCSVGDDSSAPWVHAAAAFLVLGLLVSSRRRRK